MVTKEKIQPFYELKGGKWVINPHPGQRKALESEARIILVLSGSQGGKTEIGPVWLNQEMNRRGIGDYIACTTTFPLMDLKMQPALSNFFVGKLGIANWKEAKKLFEINSGKLEGSRLILASAVNPESVEAATAKAAWLDEAGMNKFDRGTWDAILRRLTVNEGRILITTTPYNFGWLKREVYDRWEEGDKSIEVIQFPSIMNPAFPMQEWERQRARMPPWKFQMFHEGKFTKPVGLVYDCFDKERSIVSPFPLPSAWPRFVGLDFGGRNTAALWYAQDPNTGYLYAYREYIQGGMVAAEHARMLKEISGQENIIKRVGGAWSEDQWRMEFSAAGWPIIKPTIKDIEVGISRVYGWHKINKLFVFKSLVRYIDQKLRYAYSLDA